MVQQPYNPSSSSNCEGFNNPDPGLDSQGFFNDSFYPSNRTSPSHDSPQRDQVKPETDDASFDLNTIDPSLSNFGLQLESLDNPSNHAFNVHYVPSGHGSADPTQAPDNLLVEHDDVAPVAKSPPVFNSHALAQDNGSSAHKQGPTGYSQPTMRYQAALNLPLQAPLVSFRGVLPNQAPNQAPNNVFGPQCFGTSNLSPHTLIGSKSHNPRVHDQIDRALFNITSALGSAGIVRTAETPNTQPSRRTPQTPASTQRRPRPQSLEGQHLLGSPGLGSPFSGFEDTNQPNAKRQRLGVPPSSYPYLQPSAPRPALPQTPVQRLDPLILSAIDRWVENNPADFPTDQDILGCASLVRGRADAVLISQVKERFREKLFGPRESEEKFKDLGYYSLGQPARRQSQSPERHEVEETQPKKFAFPETPTKSSAQKHKCRVSGCAKSFSRKGERDKHEDTHREKKWKCMYPGCNALLSRKDKLREHIKSQHKDFSHAQIEDYLKSYHPDGDPDGGAGDSSGSGTAKPGSGNGRGASGRGGSTDGSSGNSSSQSSTGSGRTGATTMSCASDDVEISEDALGTKKEMSIRCFRYLNLEDHLFGSPNPSHQGDATNIRQPSRPKDLKSLPFRTLKHLGAGAWGSVDEIKFLQGNQSVRARKIYKLDKKADLQPRVEKEVEILKQLRHPHIIRLVGLFTTSTSFSLLLDPVAVCDLKQFMHLPSRDERLTESNFPAWFCELASALKYLHSDAVSVVHGDLKPANILVKNCHVRIADFGSASRFSPSNKARPGPFTPVYAAPEAVDGSERDQAADIFSLGCVFVEMTTVLMQFSLENFERSRSTTDNNGKRDSSFHSHLAIVSKWITKLREKSNPKRKFVNKILDWCIQMLTEEPENRPEAFTIAKDVAHSDCSTCCTMSCSTCSTMSVTEGRQDGIHWCAKCTTPNINRKLAPRLNTDLLTPNPEYCLKTFDQNFDPTELLWATHQSGRSSHVRYLSFFLGRIQQQFPLCPSGYYTLEGLPSYH